jgi:serine/threonine-protein kinase
MRRAGKIAVLLLPLLLAAAGSALAATGFPPGWSGGGGRAQDYEFGTDAMEGATGRQAAYIRAKAGAVEESYGSMTQCIKADNYIGQRLRFAARLKSINAGAARAWMRVDGPRPADGASPRALAFYNMGDNPVRGTADWQRVEVVLDVPKGSAVICYGFLLTGRGEAWADGLSLNKVGKDVAVSKMPDAINLGFNR